MKKIIKYIKNTIIFIIINWLILFILLPNVIIIIVSFLKKNNVHLIQIHFNFTNYLRLLNIIYIKIFLHSLYISLITTILCLIIGYMFSWFLIQMTYKKQSIMLMFLFLPFWINSIIRIYSLKIFLSINGWFNKFLIYLHIIKQPIHIIYTPLAVILGLIYILLPFMIIPIYNSLNKLDKYCIEAAKDLGAPFWKTFVYIIIPLTSPGIISGCLLVFLPSIGMFSINDLMGGTQNLLIGNIIKNQFLNIRDWPFGSALSSIIIFITGVLLILYWKIIYFLNGKNYKDFTNNV
ncbi:spermidine/putrescine ABC transporter permease PotB [Enterobacteriaceae endosymbiont of Neohaemonia nigricornis]|uniref:spermidine/putrescine ABC transporter permease PotB n=1 Tax=Enterobacteriaceae endosymbiont of Neohaemonia nigricornis TaxID=2675792 RepID=UPI0014495B5E|nr:spermidine/putrescine ABC transporter permease PotB [Enterobacteriaceae endosymbiont of Neohaemonia nigricornis]QJC30594.1 spermidine/putrescine ABC transporter permease PotB [Enterobacteriaceae endosymbiont of Neohaemonia nigricornis]